MKRIFFTVLSLLLMAGSTALATGVAVTPNTVPAPGLSPSSWACYPTCVFPTDIVTADFNQDGWLDLAVSCSATGNVIYYQSSGFPRGVFTGTLTLPGSVETPGRFPNAQYLLAGHIGGYNGFPDLAVVHSPNVAGGLTNVTCAGNAGVPFAIPGAPTGLVITGPIIDITGGNFTNNNVMDFAYLTAGGLNVWAWDTTVRPPLYSDLVTGIGGTLPIPGETPIAVVAADFDQNGWEDVAVVTNAPNLYIFFNTPPGAFTAGALGPIGVAIPIPTAIEAGDFDADGFLDIVVVGNRPPTTLGEQPSGLAQVFINQVHTTPSPVVPPASNFTDLPAMLTWGFNAKAVEILDADGNGRDDFAVANWGSATVTVFLADDQGLINDTRDTRVRNGPCLKPVDMNLDRLNIGFRLFKIELKCGYYPIALAAGDFDHNGKMDLAVALQSADEELCAQNNSCIEVDYDIACGFVAPHAGIPGQISHGNLQVPPQDKPQESQTCLCKDCGSNTPPKPAIDIEDGDSKN